MPEAVPTGGVDLPATDETRWAERPSHTPSHRLVAQDADLVAATLDPGDEEEYGLAAAVSGPRIARLNPVVPHDFRARLAGQGEGQRTILVRLHDPDGAADRLAAAGRWGSGRPGCAPDGAPLHGVVGRINVNNIVRGRFQSAALGYDAFDPWAGTGWFTRALALAVDLALTPVAAAPRRAGEPTGGFGLHRLEANVQPHNAASLAVLARLGFRQEGRVERMLWVPGPDGTEGWQDHLAHAITAEEWRPA